MQPTEVKYFIKRALKMQLLIFPGWVTYSMSQKMQRKI